jgi:hypothetical protein
MPATAAQTPPAAMGEARPAGAAPEAAPQAAAGATGEKSPASAAEDPAFQKVIARTKTVAARLGHNTPAQAKAAQAQAAAVSPPGEIASQASAGQVQEMAQQQPKPFDRAAFKAALLQKITSITPKNLEEADQFKKSGKVGDVKGALTTTVSQGKEQAQGGIAEKARETPDPSGIQPKPVTPLQPADPGPPPPDVGAAAAAPKPKTEADVSLQEGSTQLDQKMANADVNEEQLQKSNEPSFQGAVEAKKTAQTDAAQAPQAYRQDEQGTLAQAQVGAGTAAQTQLQGMHGGRGQLLTQIEGVQVGTKGEDEQERAKVASDIQGIYATTKQKVEDRLKQLDDEVNQAFDQGAASAQQAFEDYVEQRMDAYKFDRYLSTPGGSLLWAKDKLFGMPEEVNAFYEAGRNLYIVKMDGVLDNIATLVEAGLTEAKALIAQGKQEIQEYVSGLSPALQDVGQKAAQGIQSKFDELEQSTNDKQNQLIDSLAQKYVENLQKLDDRIKDMKASNRGLVDAALDAVNGVIDTIINLKNMLLNVLARAANAIDLVIKDPIGFLGNLVAGVRLGFNNFIGKIGHYLQQGLLQWLFGALAEAGIQMPDNFDLKGILSLVLQVLGLTYANIRARAVAILGEKVVSALEQAAEIFKILITEGPAGLWEYIKEKIGDLKSMVIDQIKSFVMERIIMAGVTWIIGLLNPASAFVKACKAIYDIIMFFVERGSQILALVNAVIDSVTAIAQGAIGVAANFVENALAKAIPVVIGFLAALLGLGGISEKIKSIIDTIRKPINAAIDWVIKKAVDLVKAAGKLLGFGKEKEDEKGKSGDVKEQAATALSQQLKSEHKKAEANEIVKSVLVNLQPQGLKKLELGPKTDKGEYIIYAEASPDTELLKLTPKRRTVRMTVTLRLTGEQPLLEGVTAVARGRNLITGEEAPLRLRPVEGRSTMGGLIIPPKSGADEVKLVTWNTGDLDPRILSNGSHAEAQFAAWFEVQPREWRRRVESIEAHINLSPCTMCAADLLRISTLAPALKTATLFWEKPYEEGPLATTTASLSSMHPPWIVKPPSVGGEKDAEYVTEK